jgi:hypothetical protein
MSLNLKGRTTMSEACHVDCTLEEYHATPGVWSNSQKEVLIKSPPLFRGRFLTGEFLRESSMEFDIGTVAHAALADPAGLDNVLAIIPPTALNEQGHRKGAAWKAWSDANAGKIQMKPGEAAPVQAMVRNVREHPKAAMLLDSPGHTEYTVTWRDEESGLLLRARPDKIAETDVGTVLVDIKTTRTETPREFSNSIVKFGYHRQAAWYMEGCRELGIFPVAFLFIVVDKSPAHECEVYQLDQRAIELGQQQNRAAINELAWRLKTNNWRQSGWGEVLTIYLPEWAYRQDQYEVRV